MESIDFATHMVQLFAPEGVWAILSLVLIFYILRRQEKRDEKLDAREEKRDSKLDARDKKYQESISKLADSMSDLDEIKKLLLEKLK